MALTFHLAYALGFRSEAEDGSPDARSSVCGSLGDDHQRSALSASSTVFSACSSESCSSALEFSPKAASRPSAHCHQQEEEVGEEGNTTISTRCLQRQHKGDLEATVDPAGDTNQLPAPCQRMPRDSTASPLARLATCRYLQEPLASPGSASSAGKGRRTEDVPARSATTPLDDPEHKPGASRARLDNCAASGEAPIPAAGTPPEPTPSGFVLRQPPSASTGCLFVSPSLPAKMARATWSLSSFQECRQLYKGYASSVSKATCLVSGQDVVLKAYSLSTLTDFLRNQVLRELDIHSKLEHPGVVQLYAAFKEGDKLVLVLEYVRGGSLDRARRKLGGRMSEQQALELVMVPLLGTLHYLHTQSIIHRDIKPENLLFTPDWRLKVCDYGVSINLMEERAVTRTGSRDYMAPEVSVCPLKRTPADNKDNVHMAYGAAVDIWSLGALAYELLVGFTPYPGGPVTACKSDPGKLPFPSSVSAEAKEFVVWCLQQDAADRPTVQQLWQHRWLSKAPSLSK